MAPISSSTDGYEGNNDGDILDDTGSKGEGEKEERI